MNCPVRHGPLEKAQFDFKSTFPCPHCHQWLRARPNLRVRIIKWIGAALAVLAFVFGDLKHSANVKDFAIAVGILLGLSELLVKNTNEAEIEPASTQGPVPPLG
jgi:hypothetical protein